MRIKQVEYRQGETVQTAPYESFRVDVGLIADVDENEDPDEVIDRLKVIIQARIDEAVSVELDE